MRSQSVHIIHCIPNSETKFHLFFHPENRFQHIYELKDQNVQI